MLPCYETVEKRAVSPLFPHLSRFFVNPDNATLPQNLSNLIRDKLYKFKTLLLPLPFSTTKQL